MKKTAISIAVLGVLCLSETAYATAPSGVQQSVYSARIPLKKVFEKLERTTKMRFFYSASDLEGMMIDDRDLNYSSLQAALGYLKKKLFRRFYDPEYYRDGKKNDNGFC